MEPVQERRLARAHRWRGGEVSPCLGACCRRRLLKTRRCCSHRPRCHRCLRQPPSLHGW